MTFKGKTAVITGASSGIGADFARLLARSGCARIVLVARREDRLLALKSELEGLTTVSVATLDLTAPGACRQLAGDFPETDILINNAGYGLHGYLLDVSLERTLNLVDLDVRVLTELTHRFAASMKKRGGGRILQIASVMGFQAVPGYAAYAAAKSYVLHFGESLHHELKRSGVTVTTLAPGVTATEFFAVAGQRPNLYHRLVAMRSEAVARIGLHALGKGKLTVIPGFLNRMTAFLNRLAPRWIQGRIAGQLMRD